MATGKRAQQSLTHQATAGQALSLCLGLGGPWADPGCFPLGGAPSSVFLPEAHIFPGESSSFPTMLPGLNWGQGAIPHPSTSLWTPRSSLTQSETS